MLIRKNDGITIFLVGVGLLVAMVNLWSCSKRASLEPKNRPVGVPTDATWIGGADGGAYVRCTVNLARDVNPCNVWNDYTGNMVESGDYRLVKEGRAATQSELHVSFPDFSGLIYLRGGLILKRQ